jgi:hypothetical protein
MKTAAECLAKAEENDAAARGASWGFAREEFIRTADGWRKVALLARQQEVWEQAHPDG